LSGFDLLADLKIGRIILSHHLVGYIPDLNI